MLRHTVSVLLASSVLSAGLAVAQLPPNPMQRPVTVTQGPTPIFRITVVGRTTSAVNYRPRSGSTKIDFTGTTLMPRATGEAKISGEKGNIRIDAKFGHMGSASQFGHEYLTYVLWAITPEGRATNLGEVQVRKADAKMEVTTQLQAFGLIVTAEPYFAVTQPSDAVVMENIIRDNTRGTLEVVQAKYELLTRGSYLMRQDISKLKLKPLVPGSSLDLAEARNAVELARVAGADHFATQTYDKAAGLLATAENAHMRRLGSNAIMMPARQAAQTAEDARIIALKQQEDTYQADVARLGAAREQGAIDRARMSEAERGQAEREKATADAARLAAERNAAGSDAARLAAERNLAGADAARLAAETAQREAEAAKLTSEAQARLAAETAERHAEAARLAASAQARSASEKATQDQAVLREKLRLQLNVILATRETARGLVVNLSDVLFDTGSSVLKPGSREKLARLSGILASHAELRISVEGHTDSEGAEAYNQTLSEHRAESVRVYLVQQGIASNAIVSSGLGEGSPVATNGTSAGRQQNRRVELVVSGTLIGNQ